MKNKELYDLTSLDYYEEDGAIVIYRIRTLEKADTVPVYFDETPFRAYVRWLESGNEAEQSEKES